LERHLRSRLSPDADVSATVSDLASHALAASGAVRRGATALDELARRFDERAVREFDADARAAWRALLGRHISECLDALDTLDRLLAPYFGVGETVSIASATTLRGATGRLVTDASTIDQAVSGVLTAVDESVAASRLASALDVRHHIRRARRDAEFIRTLTLP
jgi:hypothetical protein